VTFDAAVSTIQNPRINEWLSEMEKQMRLTLAKNLAKAVQVPILCVSVKADKFCLTNFYPRFSVENLSKTTGKKLM
jgi:hypothetical protein